MAEAGGMQALHRAALGLQARGKARTSRGKRLPALMLMTDPARLPDPLGAVRRLPPGSAVVFRAFGAADAVAQGRQLAQAARRRGVVLLAGADPALAMAIGAGGVHLPERLAHRARTLRRTHPRWLITVAAHGQAAIRRAGRFGADAVVVSPVFESRSASAGRPLGLVRFVALANGAGTPVYALGGMNAATARRLMGSGAIGIAAVEGLA